MQLNRNYVWPVTSINKQEMDYFIQSVTEHANDIKNKKIGIWGAGIKGNEYAIYLKRLGYGDFVFIDNNTEKQGGTIEQYPIVSLDDFISQYVSCFIFIAIENGQEMRLQLLERGFIENQDFLFLKPRIYDQFMDEFKKQYTPRYLVFGDCEFTSISIEDVETINLAQMCIDKFGKDETKVLAMHGMGIRAFYHMLKSQMAYGQKPQHVILEVNLLTFTRTRHLLPRSQHVELLKKVYAVCKTDEMKEYIDEAQKRFNNFYTDFFVNSVKSKDESQNDDSIKIYIKLNYMYKFTADIEGIVYLRKMIQFCRNENIVLGLFIPPVNYKLAESFFGKSFWEKYDLVRNSVIDIVKQEGEKIEDFSKLLNDSQFCIPKTPDETANYEGRKIVLDEIYRCFGEEDDH